MSIFLDDDTGVAEAREQVRQGSFASEADSASATIEPPSATLDE